MRNLWPAWKVSLLSFLFALGIVVAIAGMSSDDHEDAEAAGERAGRKYGAILVFAPLVAYIVQKTRIDKANQQR